MAVIILFAGFYFIRNGNIKEQENNISSKISLPLDSHIVTKEDSNNTEINKIKNQISNLLTTKYPNDNISLRGFGGDFAVITINRPTGAGSIDELINLKSGESATLGQTSFSVTVPSGFVYIDYNKINYYALGEDSPVILSGSILNNNETYNSGGDMLVTPEETHDDSSITVNIFNSSLVATGEGTSDYKLKKIRTETFYFSK